MTLKDRQTKASIDHFVIRYFERTHKLLGPLAQKPRVSCPFVDPIADIAVLGAPDAREFTRKGRLGALSSMAWTLFRSAT
jgi:hypothetical protein